MNVDAQTTRIGKDTTIVAFGDFIAKAILRNADGVIALTEDMKKGIQKLVGKHC